MRQNEIVVIDPVGVAVIEKALFVAFLLDESGSMHGIAGPTIEAFNDFRRDLIATKAETRMTLSLFDSHHHTPRFIGVSAEDIPPLDQESYRPGRETPLYDAIFRSVQESEGWIAEHSWRDKVLVAILTDGHENASVEHPGERGRQEVKALIERKEGEGWNFLFVGAGLDAAHFGRTIGTPATMTYSTAHSSAGMRAASAHLKKSARAARR